MIGEWREQGVIWSTDGVGRGLEEGEGGGRLLVTAELTRQDVASSFKSSEEERNRT